MKSQLNRIELVTRPDNQTDSDWFDCQRLVRVREPAHRQRQVGRIPQRLQPHHPLQS